VKLEPVETSVNVVDLLESLPSASDDSLSPMPSPSQMPKYFMDKVQKSIKSHSRVSTTASTPSKAPMQSPRIPPSGTPVKSELNKSPLPETRFLNHLVKDEPDPLSSHMDRDLSDLSDLEKVSRGDDYIQIAFLKPRFVEFGHSFPAFPKTHIDGYAYVIELSPEILNEKALHSLRDALQYSLTGGGGPKTYENVKFFASDNQKVPMKIHSRQCAGMTSATS
jgi:hypothetical protein